MFVDNDAAIFSIAAASELADMHPQTLRQYDRMGLVVPHRTTGGTRRYSARDVRKLRQIQELSLEGVSLEGIRRVFHLEDTVNDLNKEIDRLKNLLEKEIQRRPNSRIFAAGPAGSVVSMKFGRRAQKRGQLVRWTGKMQ